MKLSVVVPQAIGISLCNILLHPWAEKINTSLTQKDTMDRGAWIKISERRQKGGLKRKDKSPKAQKCKMAWEWGTNEYLCLPYVTILWCLSWYQPKGRGKKWNSYSWPQKSYLDFEILVSILPKWDYHQWLKVHTSTIEEIHTSRRIQHVGIYCQNSLLLKEEFI